MAENFVSKNIHRQQCRVEEQDRVVEQLRPTPFSGVWCAVSARNIIGPMSVVNKKQYIRTATFR
jgi:hypothetical protein